MLHQQAAGNVTLLDGVREMRAFRPTVTCELLEVPRGPTMATRQLQDTTGAPQVVPDIDMRPRDTRPRSSQWWSQSQRELGPEYCNRLGSQYHHKVCPGCLISGYHRSGWLEQSGAHWYSLINGLALRTDEC